MAQDDLLERAHVYGISLGGMIAQKPAPSRTAIASSAISGVEYGSGTRSLRPTPRLSKAMTGRLSARMGTVGHQPVALTPSPITRSTGVPASRAPAGVSS